MKRKWLKEVGGGADVRGQDEKLKSLDPATNGVSTGLGAGGVPKSFWEDDEGLAEVRRGSKLL